LSRPTPNNTGVQCDSLSSGDLQCVGTLSARRFESRGTTSSLERAVGQQGHASGPPFGGEHAATQRRQQKLRLITKYAPKSCTTACFERHRAPARVHAMKDGPARFEDRTPRRPPSTHSGASKQSPPVDDGSPSNSVAQGSGDPHLFQDLRDLAVVRQPQQAQRRPQPDRVRHGHLPPVVQEPHQDPDPVALADQLAHGTLQPIVHHAIAAACRPLEPRPPSFEWNCCRRSCSCRCCSSNTAGVTATSAAGKGPIAGGSAGRSYARPRRLDQRPTALVRPAAGF